MRQPQFLNTDVFHVHQLPACTGNCHQGRLPCSSQVCQPTQSDDDEPRDPLGVFRALAFVVALDVAVIAAVIVIAWAAKH